jgi:NAD(P)-dependent dehydrogenase (short-subunit alcohol dehydrogenase family)
MRLANTYLMLAEALLRDGKPDLALPWINKVRERAAKPGQQAAMDFTLAQLTAGGIDLILDERARELTGETTRWFDLVRTGKLIERVTLYNPGGAPNIKPFHVLRPIPNSEILLRPGHEAEPGLLITRSRVGRRGVSAAPDVSLCDSLARPPSSPARARASGAPARCASRARALASCWRTARSQAESLQGEIERGGICTVVEADVARRADSEHAIDVCVERYGAIDILFCNAGITPPKLLHESADDEIERLLQVNLLAIVYAARHAIPRMLAQPSGARCCSRRARRLVADRFPVYCASKGAVVMLAKALALDYATKGIRVNALCPGIIETPMLRQFTDSRPDPAASWASYTTAQPMGRLGTPEECADAALWLVSDEASFITGVAPVDGGFTAM